MPIRPGEIYPASAHGDARRRVLIVSREELNRGGYVVAIPFTSTRFEIRSKLPSAVPFQAGQFGLTKDCVALAESISLLEAGMLDLESGPVGTLDEEAMRDVIRAIGYVMESVCEPC